MKLDARRLGISMAFMTSLQSRRGRATTGNGTD
jgi:hypothetical protein